MMQAIADHWPALAAIWSVVALMAGAVFRDKIFTSVDE